MMSRSIKVLLLLILCCAAGSAPAQTVRINQRAMDPFGSPRPAHVATGVPIRTSICVELEMDKPKDGDRLTTSSVTVTLQALGKEPREVIKGDGRFARGFKGWVKATGRRDQPGLAIYIDPTKPLNPLTTYTVRIAARSIQGVALTNSWATPDHWSFMTGPAPKKQNLAFNVDLTGRPVHWQGGLFSGFCKVSFCTSHLGLEPSYEMMARDQKKSPRAWVLQRDFWMTGMEHVNKGIEGIGGLPNIVRERETRRIAEITTVTEGYLLKVEDFLGHEQYGIASNRPLSGDYKKGYEILIADGENHARAKVLAVDDKAGTVLVSRFEMPAEGFKVKILSRDELIQNVLKSLFPDPATRPDLSEIPDMFKPSTKSQMPGNFPAGGCYLRRFAPTGTAHYYWGRLDKEWDIARKYGRRLMVNFTDAPGDLADKGKNWCPPKDYAQLHEVTRAITSHVIERYGAEAALDAVWSIFNEPDLRPSFWHGTAEDLDIFYDYSVDAILRAFEDHNLDSSKVFIGGLELGAIFATLGGLDEFLIHCSPNGTTTESLNYAYADKRLDGKRSRRVEELCRAHGGKGTPCDFISVHAYNSSKVAAGKMKLAKDKALAIDPQHYDKLWICSHEATPDWVAKPDEAFDECYQGNGYYPSWCADWMWRQLDQGAKDPRYAMGSTILTCWPWPSAFGFGATGAVTQNARVDDDGDGKGDRDVTVPMPIYNFLNLLGSLQPDYWVLPEQTVNGHTVAGFAARGFEGDLRVLLFAHEPEDVQARAGQDLKVEVNVNGLAGRVGHVTQYRFDSNHHSCIKMAKKFKKEFKPKSIFDQRALNAKELSKLEGLVALNAEKVGKIKPGKDGSLRVPAKLTGNSVTFLVIRSEE